MRREEPRAEDIRKPKKKEPVHICYECGKTINPGEPVEHIVTKRWTQIWIHQKCIRR